MNEGVTSIGVTFAAISALGWGGLDASRKALVRHVDPLPSVVLLTWGQLPIFGMWWAWLAFSAGAPSIPMEYWLPGLGAVGLNVAANLLFMTGMRLSPLSVTVPFLAFVPVFTTLIANPILGELPTPISLVGIAIVVIGALTLNADLAPSRGLVGLIKGLLKERGSLPMLGVALCWSMAIIFDKLATAQAPPAVHGTMLNLGVGSVLLLWMTARRDLSRLRQARSALHIWAVAVVVGSIGLGMQLMAVGHLYVAILEAIKRAVGLAMSVILGRLLFKERITGLKVSAVALMAGGAAVVVLG